MAVKLRRRYNKPSRDYQILTIALNYDDDEAARRIKSVLGGEHELTERERRIIMSLFRHPNEIIRSITKGAYV